MERIWWLPLTLIAIVGCQSQPPMNNPFQTTVPAPGTAGTGEAPLYSGVPAGQMAPAGAGAYIPGGTVTPTAPGATLGTPAYGAPTYGTPTAPVVPSAPNTPSNQYYPPGNSFDMRQSSLNRPDTAADLAGGPVPETAPVEPLEPTGAEFNPRRRRRTASPAKISRADQQQTRLVARTEEARPTERIQFPQPASVADARHPSNTGTELRIINSSDVEAHSTASWSERDREVGETTASSSVAAADEETGREHQVARQDDTQNMEIMRASFNQPVTSTEDRPTPTEAAFRHDPNYQSLQGKLEYSQSTRQWKLRYIPIDGDTDRFGGSVILSDSDLLGGYRPGEFVSIAGSLSESKTATKGFAPHYEVEQIRRQKS